MMLKSRADYKRKSEGTESITFRIGKSILDELRQDADHKLKSVNILVNQIIKSYITWHKPARKTGFGYFDNVLVSYIINILSDEQIIQVAEQYCKQRLKDIAFMLYSENTFLSFIGGILCWIETSGFSYKYNNVDDAHTLIIKFDMGRNWSLYFKTYMQLVLEYYKIKDARCEMTDNTVIIKIKPQYI